MPSDDSPAETALAILAGGRGARMGGPKAWLRIRGQAILEYLLDRFDWPGPTILVTAPGLEHPPAHHRFSLQAIDSVADRGPLQGMFTAVTGCRITGTSRLIIATVDMPCIAHEHLFWLAQRLGAAPDAIGCMPVRMVEGQERLEPFPCAVNANADGVLSAQLDQGVRAVHSLVPAIFMPVPVPAEWVPSMWTNLNRPEDLATMGADFGTTV